MGLLDFLFKEKPRVAYAKQRKYQPTSQQVRVDTSSGNVSPVSSAIIQTSNISVSKEVQEETPEEDISEKNESLLDNMDTRASNSGYDGNLVYIIFVEENKYYMDICNFDGSDRDTILDNNTYYLGNDETIALNEAKKVMTNAYRSWVRCLDNNETFDNVGSDTYFDSDTNRIIDIGFVRDEV